MRVRRALRLALFAPAIAAATMPVIPASAAGQVVPASAAVQVVPASAAGQVVTASAVTGQVAGAAAARVRTPRSGHRTIAAAHASPKPSRPPSLRAARSNRVQPQAKPIEVAITSVSPNPAVTENSKIHVKATVSNQSGHTLTGVTLRLRYSTHRIVSRGLLAGQPPAAQGIDGPAVPLGQVSAGATTGPRDLQLDAAKLVRNAPKDLGVYSLTVVAMDLTGRFVGEQSTFVVYAPSGFTKTHPAIKVAWVLPMIDKPHRVGNANVPVGTGTTTAEFQDDDLNAEFGAGGRLGSLAAAGAAANAPITWAIDPALLADAQDMAGSKGYQVENAKKPASATAKTWLAQVFAAQTAATSSYFTLPFADPDAVALVRHGMKDQLTTAYKRGAAVMSEVQLARSGELKIAWPADGAADQKTLVQLASYDQNQSFLLSSDQLASTVTNESYTPSATMALDVHGKRKAMAYDSTISNVISGDTSTANLKTLTEQRFLAETAMMAAEYPLLPRTLVIAPDRYWDPGPGLAADLLGWTGGTGHAPWLAATPLNYVLNTLSPNRTLAGYTQAARGNELPDTYLDGVSKVSDAAAALATIYMPRPKDHFRDGVLRAESSSWRTRRKAARQFVKDIGGKLAAVESQIRIASNPTAALAGGTNAPVPFTIVNDLPDKIRIRVDVTSQYPVRLQIGPYSHTRVIDAHHKDTVYVQMRASANSLTTVYLQLWTNDGTVKIGARRTITVRTTGYVTTALIIVGSGLAVLVVGVGVRANRARRRRMRARQAEDVAAGGPGI